ncbi:MAG TPA: cupin domain-containing protein [Terriglobales bacterium]|jgi:glc operon protein GlcG|nr:cupin domain-containing protein [Terriglobales bacterium]
MSKGRLKKIILTIAVFALSVAGSAAEEKKSARASGNKKAASEPLPVLYFSSEQTNASFEKGSTLFDGEHFKRHYFVNTSRRDKPGTPELHMLFTDIVYVMKGSATVVTGGKMVDLKTNLHFPNGEPYPKDELRGGRIIGGESRKLSVGDVIIIPNGVPHAFTEVEAPFWYYVVKAR